MYTLDSFHVGEPNLGRLRRNRIEPYITMTTDELFATTQEITKQDARFQTPEYFSALSKKCEM